MIILRVFQMRDHRCRSTGHHKNSRHPAFAGCREHMIKVIIMPGSHFLARVEVVFVFHKFPRRRPGLD